MDGQSLSAEVTIRQVNDSLARVLIRIKPDEYLYVRQEDNRYLATVGIHLQLVESYDVPTRYDSAVARYTMDMTEKGKARIFEVELPVHRKGTILLETVITDEGKGASATFSYRLLTLPRNPASASGLPCRMERRSFVIM